MASMNVTVRLNRSVGRVRLAVSTSPTISSPTYFASSSFTAGVAKFACTGLTANTQYYCAVEINGLLRMTKQEHIGSFKTPPSGASSFRVALAGDCRSSSSEDAVFNSIRGLNPLFFIHMGDRHYNNIEQNSPVLYRDAYNAVLKNHHQRRLHRQVPVVYMWDDHDFGANDSFGAGAGHDAACQVYRERVPHHTLEETGTTDPIYHSFEVGRVVFIITDLRSEASDKAATDNSSKTMMGTIQKTWFKGLLSDVANANKLFVWVCSRVIGGAVSAGADHWGGFTTERTEIWDHIQANCPGRICILSADEHMLAIDDGTNHDFVTVGTEPVPVFQAAPLDQSMHTSYANGSYSEGRFDTNPGQFGIMDITDSGGATITVNWTGYNRVGGTLVTHQFAVSV